MTLSQPVDRVFEFFSDAANLEKITPPELNFKILTPQPLRIHEGCLIDYQLSLFRMRFKWRTGIVEWSPPDRFVDEQLRGPYSKWVHTHSFAERDGRTTIDDKVVYKLPLSPLGDIALPLVKLQLRRIFTFRQGKIRELLEGS